MPRSRESSELTPLPESKAMTSVDHERVLALKEATRNQNPETYVNVRVKDLNFLTDAVLQANPAPPTPSEPPVEIDGGFTKQNTSIE